MTALPRTFAEAQNDAEVSNLLSRLSDEQLERGAQRARDAIKLIVGCEEAWLEQDHDHDGHPGDEMALSRQGQKWISDMDRRLVATYRKGLQEVETEQRRRQRSPA